MSSLISLSKRVKTFINAADENGNIKNNPLIIQYLAGLDVALIKAGITTGAVYPFVGGTAFSHKYNFFDPRDLDAAFRLTFINSPTHTNNGIKFLRANSSYADTHLIPSIHQNVNHCLGVGIYDETERFIDDAEIGTVDNSQSPATAFIIATRRSDNRSIGQFRTTGGGTTTAIKTGQMNGLGIHIVTKISNNSTLYIQNGNTIAQSTTNALGMLTNSSVFIGADSLPSGIANAFSSKGINFAIILPSFLTEDIAKRFSHDIYVLQRSLGRV